MSIRCGNHKGEAPTYHETVTDVRACFAGARGGEQTYNDVILTKGELAKIATEIRGMEDKGILPRGGSTRPTFPSMADAFRDTRGGSIASDRASRYLPNSLSPKGREIHTGFGGSPKQYDFIYGMLEELGGVSENFRWDVITNVGLASKEIDRLQVLVREQRSERTRSDYHTVYSDGAAYDAPKPVRQTVTGQVSQDGIYRNPATGELFKVQVAVHGSGNLYAKQAFLSTLEGDLAEIPLSGDLADTDRLDWLYKPGLLSKIKPEWRVTREEAVAFGALYGQCIRCGRTLTKDSSIEQAMGDTCRGKLGF